MKKSIIFGAAVILLGLFIALGPQFLFKTCGHGENYPQCFWSARAEIGIGFLIAGLGIAMIVFKDPKAILGLAIASFLASLIALAVPHTLIGGCSSAAMKCRRIAFPALTVEGLALLVFSAVLVVFFEMQNRSRKGKQS